MFATTSSSARAARTARATPLPAGHLAGACAVLALAGSVAAMPQGVPRLREAGDARLPAELAGRLGMRDPAADDWAAEIGNAELGARHRRIAAWLADPAAGPEGLDWAAADVRARLPVAPRANEGVNEVASEGERERGGWTLVRPLTPDEGTRGREALARGLRSLTPAGPAELFELKTWLAHEEEDGSLREGARLHAAHLAPRGGWELTAEWRARWVRDEQGELVLAELEVEDAALVRGDGPRFVDRTHEVLGATRAFRDELSRGISSWRRRLDTRLGLPILGHPAGVAVADVDGDGLEDLFLCQPGGLANRLFLHRPDGAVVDVSARAGVDHLDFARSALLLDLDRDGDRDLAVVLRSDLVLLSNLLVEEGELRFEPVWRRTLPNPSMLTAADFDLDGDLDLYACCYATPYEGGDLADYPTPYHDARNGSPNALLVNEGGWSFRDATEETGLHANNHRFSLAASWEDYDLDGDPDLYVANDFGRNNLYRNEGGVFVDVAAAAGVEDLAAGMGVSWADVDGDGDMDLHVANMYSSAGKRVTYERRFQPRAGEEERAELRRHALGDTLFLNQGDGTFRDATPELGVAMGRWAWGALFCDLDDDGRPDLFVPNGFLTSEVDDDL